MMISNKKGSDVLKKSLSILLLILIITSAFAPFIAYAAVEQQTSGSCGDNATFELVDGVLTISGTGEITSHPWREYVGETTNINKAIIGEGITVIGQYSFAYCTNLREVILPESLKGIKQSAFSECEKLEKADLPSNLKYIGTRAFYRCRSLKKIELPNNLETIYESAFNGCYSASGKLTIHKNTIVQRYAFNYCKNITEFVFEEGFSGENLYNGCFQHCEKLKRVYIPGSFKEMSSSYFSDCVSLTDITLCEGVEAVCGFAECTALEKIILPQSVKCIKSAAFDSCDKLKTVKIQSKLSTIGDYAFYNCPSLKSIKIPYGVDKVEKRAFGYYETVDQVIETAEGGTKEIKSEHKIKNFKVYGKKCKALTDYCKENGFTFIDMYDVSNAAAEMKSQTYNGSAKKPSVTVKLAGTTLKKDTDYTIKYSNNTKVGTAKVTLTGIGKYKGTLEKTFKINPKPTELTKLTAGSKSFKAYWKKRTTQTSGYQIQYSTYKDLKNAKIVTISSYKTGARTIKNLKAKKNYFVRIRTYKIVSGKKYYSKWSEIMKVTTK